VLVAIAAKVFPDKGVPDFFLHPVAPAWSHTGYAVLALVIAIGLSALLYRRYEHPAERKLRAVLRGRLARGGSEHVVQSAEQSAAKLAAEHA
jgi:peptidoglycan/LPS O-acetylase OafA/YrhL